MTTLKRTECDDIAGYLHSITAPGGIDSGGQVLRITGPAPRARVSARLAFSISVQSAELLTLPVSVGIERRAAASDWLGGAAEGPRGRR